MTPEMPLLAVEWGTSQCSPGISLGPVDQNAVMPPPATLTTIGTGGKHSQHATLQYPTGKTVSLAGHSIEPAVKNHRHCTSEGTVQVVQAHVIHHTAAGPQSPRITIQGGATIINGVAATFMRENSAQPANSAAAPISGALLRKHSSFPPGSQMVNAEPEDSTTAISQAPKLPVGREKIESAKLASARSRLSQEGAGGLFVTDPMPVNDNNNALHVNLTQENKNVDQNHQVAAGGTRDGAPNNCLHNTTEWNPKLAKPSDSLSSAAVVNGMPAPGDKNTDIGAASLASHHEGIDFATTIAGTAAAALATAEVDLPTGVSTAHGITINHGTATDEEAMPAPPLPSILTPSAARMGGGTSVVIAPNSHHHHGFTQLQIQSVVSAALHARVSGPLAARPGDSSSSANRPLVLVGLKRKKTPGGGRPPMAPPAQRGGAPNNATTNANTNNAVPTPSLAQPTASSPGIHHHVADYTIAVEDAVSMVEQCLSEAEVEVACDAVSKASDSDDDIGRGAHGDNDNEYDNEGFVGSGCPSLMGAGMSMASAGGE